MNLSRNEPLVTVIACSYNSSNTILDTLNSIFLQSYPRIELVLCDDASIDETMDIACKWLSSKHVSDRFESIKMVRQPCNIGLVKNLAAGLSAATGEWIKPIACDDALVPAALSAFISKAYETGSAWIFSQCEVFKIINHKFVKSGNLVSDEAERLMLKATHKELIRKLSSHNFFPAPGVFYSREFIELAGGQDLRFRNLEDWPLWIGALNNGLRPTWIPNALVLYRISESSLTWLGKNCAVNELLFLDELVMMRIYLRKIASSIEYWDLLLKKIRQWIVLKLLGNYQISANLIKPLALLSPLAWIRFINYIMKIIKY